MNDVSVAQVRNISWVLLVDRGARENPTFRFDAIQKGLDYLGEFWALSFQRLNTANARVKFICSKSVGGPGWVAWANRGNLEIRISPVFDFRRNLLTCATAVVHEFFHLAGGTAHSPYKEDIMSPALEPGEQITVRDANYMPYSWRSSRRPWNEPNYFRQKFTEGAMSVNDVSPLVFPEICCRGRTWEEWYNSIGCKVSSAE